MSFNTHSHDVGLFHSALWNSLHGNWLLDSVRGQFYLADHLIFFLYFLIPFYWIYSGPETLYFLSAVAFAFSAFFIFKLAKERLKNELAAFLIFTAFASNRYIWGAFLHEFHPDFFAPLFLFILFFSFYQKKFFPFFLSFVCILILKEDYALYLIPAGIYFFIQKEGKPTGLAVILISVVYFGAAYFWILPHMQKISGITSGYTYVNSWSHLGSGPFDIVRNLVLNPAAFLSSISYKTIFTFFTKFIFLPFLSPASLLFLLPPIFLYTSAQFELIRGLSVHYGLIPAAFGFIAVIEAVRNLEKMKIPKNLTPILISILCVVGLFRFTFFIPMPESGELKMRQDGFMKKRPICVQSSLFPHLVPDGSFSIFPECSAGDKYLLLFAKAETYPFSKPEFQKRLSEIIASDKWQLKENSGGVMLFEK